MAKAQPGKTRWQQIIKRGLKSGSRQWDAITLLREDIRSLWAASEKTPEVIDFLLLMTSKLDSVAETNSEMQASMSELFSIGADVPEDEDE